jgi:hypothetical protein
MKELVIAIGNEFSGIGYAQIALQHYSAEIIYYKSSKWNLRKAEQAVFHTKIHGWVECEGSGYKESFHRKWCKKCNLQYSETEIDNCPKCGSALKDSSFINIVFKLKKTGMLQSHQAEIMLQKRSKEVVISIEEDKNLQKSTDRIIHTRMQMVGE